MEREFVKFVQHWNNIFSEIKVKSYDKKECRVIYNSFHKEKLKYLITSKELTREEFYELNRLETKLSVAIAIACSNFRKEKRGFWSKILSGKKVENIVKI